VFVGPSAVFTNVRTPRAHVSRRGEFGATHVERRVTVGANATIVCGVRLGTRAFVAAGAVVTRDVAPGVLVVGCPARPAGYACDCGERLWGEGPTWTCARCRRRWEEAEHGGIDEMGARNGT
jgi:UDP-2-acetamido-3-amino-2,3-dideoxy-glucuronate N-acetyltransferase